jgi:hypothetical protein
VVLLRLAVRGRNGSDAAGDLLFRRREVLRRFKREPGESEVLAVPKPGGWVARAHRGEPISVGLVHAFIIA